MQHTAGFISAESLFMFRASSAHHQEYLKTSTAATGTCVIVVGQSPHLLIRAGPNPSKWYSLLLLGYKPVQHVTVLNTVGNCNTVVSIIKLVFHLTNIIILTTVLQLPTVFSTVTCCTGL